MSIPSQEETNWLDPEEHFLWGLRNMPTLAGTGAVTNPLFLRGWSKHLWECGFAHRDYLESLADENGNIHVSKLPRQTKKFQPAIRGPRHGYNNAATWVDVQIESPKPFAIQDVRKLTIQEQHAVKDMLIETGVVETPKPQPPLAEEFNE